MTQQLLEGGNVFKDAEGVVLTRRINRADVVPTVKWLESITGLDLLDNMLGTTGQAETSGDLDLAVDANQVDKAEFVAKLSDYIKQQGGNPKEWIKKSGINVHFKAPIRGNPDNGMVQADFMFGEPDWMKWSMRGGREGSQLRGAHRHIIMSSIAKARGLKWSWQNGLVDRATNQVITRDPNEIAKKLLGQGANAKTIETADDIIDFAIKLPNYEELVADARVGLGRDGVELPKAGTIESVREGSIGWFRSMIEIVK